jgi:hypothetical protein
MSLASRNPIQQFRKSVTFKEAATKQNITSAFHALKEEDREESSSSS